MIINLNTDCWEVAEVGLHWSWLFLLPSMQIDKHTCKKSKGFPLSMHEANKRLDHFSEIRTPETDL